MIELVIVVVGILTIIIYVLKGKWRYVSASPNQWLVVLRDGTMVPHESGVGKASYIGLTDQYVKFPSKINRLGFQAQQITVEKQGLEVVGVLIWSINRENDGPFRAYKFLGEDISSQSPVQATETLKEMCNSIVRDRVSNSTIDDILRNRQAIRNEIRKEMQTIVSGWGVWLESVEITDVKILSKSLFENLQIEFREEQRSRAEVIKMKTQSDLESRKIDQAIEQNRRMKEAETKKRMLSAQEDLKVLEEKQKLSERESEVNRLKLEAEFKQQAYEAELNRQATLEGIARQEEIENREKNFKLMQEESEMAIAEAKMKRTSAVASADREVERLDGEMKNKLLAAIDYRLAALQAAKEVYSNLNISELKMVNFDNAADDSIVGLMSKLVTSVDTLNKK